MECPIHLASTIMPRSNCDNTLLPGAASQFEMMFKLTRARCQITSDTGLSISKMSRYDGATYFLLTIS